MSVAAELRHIWSKLSGQRARAQKRAKHSFQAALGRMGPGDVAVDLGANVGEFTVPMAATGAQVYAFEPDPHALTLLRKAVSGFNNVTLVPAAAGVTDGQAALYRKDGFDKEPDRATKSSSLFAQKSNVDPASAVEIQVIDLARFLAELGRPVALIKMDIEGGEVDVMETLLDSPLCQQIAEIYVETHERKLPDLAQRTAHLRVRTQTLSQPRVNWDWH